MMNKISVDGYECHAVVSAGSGTTAYMIYPALEPFEDKWVERMSSELEINLVIVYVPASRWNDALTPWPEPGETKEADPFGGKAMEFLELLRSKILPEVERECRISATGRRDLIGVSLGGLFTLWQWMISDTFTSIASLSGSFWYPDFLAWFERQPLPVKTGKAYFLLGEEEPKTHIKAFKSVGMNTELIVKRLKSGGIPTEFEWVPGNHFTQPVHRAERALRGLYRS